MTNKTFDGVVDWLKSWFYTKPEVDALITGGASNLTLVHSQTFKGVTIEWYSDGLYVYVKVNGSFTGLTANGYTNVGTMTDKDYAPPFTIVEVLTGATALSTLTITDTGILGVHNKTSGTSFTANTTSMYPLKSRMGGVVPVVESITLTSDKSVLSAYDGDTCTLTATVTGTNVDGLEVEFFKGTTSLGTSVVSNGVATKSYSASGVGDVTITAECMNVQETYSLEDCIIYDSLTSNSGKWTVPSGVTSSYSSDGWRISANAYKQIKLTEKLTSDCSVEFTLMDYSTPSGNNPPVIVYQYTNGETTPNQLIIANGYYSTLNVLGNTLSRSLVKGAVYKIEYTNSTMKVYENDTLLASASNTVGLPTRFEWHMGANSRYAIYKDLKVKPL